MLAGRPQEAVSNGSPRWMAVGPRSRGCTEPGLQAGSPAAYALDLHPSGTRLHPSVGHGPDGHGRRGRKPSSIARRVAPVTTVDALLAVYDQQMRGVEPAPPAWVRYERDGPLLRAAGGHRGY